MPIVAWVNLAGPCVFSELKHLMRKTDTRKRARYLPGAKRGLEVRRNLRKNLDALLPQVFSDEDFVSLATLPLQRFQRYVIFDTACFFFWLYYKYDPPLGLYCSLLLTIF